MSAAIPTLLQVAITLVTILGGGAFGSYLTYRQMAPKSSAEAREITSAAIDKDWARFEREIDRLVKRCERAEREAAQARKGQRECEERESGLKARIQSLEAVNAARGEIRSRASEIVAADRLAARSLADEKDSMK